ncbi:hypothetical protein BRC81_05900 [Halobacteriales archaeon QS_1_68_20]|nr:MAG: hypothetical protein BRC81_05900 [Halobacteriales archaeon QS_1_68_20]
MDATERTQIRDVVVDEAEGVLAGVEERWNDVPRMDPFTVEPLPGQDDAFPGSPDEFFDRFYPYAAGTVVTDDDGRVLCVRSEIREVWETPGGAGEDGETPAETARRETREETGVDPELTGVLLTRLMEIHLGEPEKLPVPVVVFTADPAGGAVLDDDAVADHGEVTDLAWFGPEELPEAIREREQVLAHQRAVRDGT